jgi:hypothetical protein
MPRGAATAPAITPPVVARKFLRVGERGPAGFDIEFLNVEFKNGTLYPWKGFKCLGDLCG